MTRPPAFVQTSQKITTEPHSGQKPVDLNWLEIPSEGGSPAAWLYADRDSFHSGETVNVFLSTNVEWVTLRIYRDGAKRTLVHEASRLKGEYQPISPNAYIDGCGWRASYHWTTDGALPSGAYLIEVTEHDSNDGATLGHHLVFLRSPGNKKKTLALVASVATWRAYNDFGGASHYWGVHPDYFRGFSPILSTKRPWGRGQVWLPDGAPRIKSNVRPRSPRPARYEALEYAYAKGLSRNYGAAGWASYERLFVRWAEKNGYSVDILTQDELHHDQDILNDYPCAVFVGHCEYWTREMRNAVHVFLNQGGNVARLAGDFSYQIRMDYETSQQICYTAKAPERDPVYGTENSHLLTVGWEDPKVNWPGAETFGVNAVRGAAPIGFGNVGARAARGFTVFRPDHWSFDGTGLDYADMFGDEHGIFGFETDGLNYTFLDGLPIAIEGEGCPPGLDILAMGWGRVSEGGLPEHRYAQLFGDDLAVLRARWYDRKEDRATVAKHSAGTGMIVSFRSGAGEVFTAATTDWVLGLEGNDFYTSTVTSNVLDRFLQGKSNNSQGIGLPG